MPLAKVCQFLISIISAPYGGFRFVQASAIRVAREFGRGAQLPTSSILFVSTQAVPRWAKPELQ